MSEDNGGLSEAEIQALADEAEAGYDVEAIRSMPRRTPAPRAKGREITDEAFDAASDLAFPDDAGMWLDNADHFNCGEANLLAELFRTWGNPQLAETFLEVHGEDDDEGDLHYNYKAKEA